ncbi:dienelactone hydrolase [Rhizobium rhizosphaerae]|uniref:Dienelactone hydrolase n=1 Tax=Xaviernesmea rhizosphaerae TaxID=1672749 RepID=A0ABX3PHD2_9HYPH|nr:dienelactone hydrolase [Xaviernesmea rhizosphaerae]OQP87520.1 dienelactone hydrolase [Xaviernesmea rhizosphaerae]
MKTWRHSLAAFLLLVSALPVLAAEQVGVRQIEVQSPARGKALSVTIWYPAEAGGAETLVGNSSIFAGTPAFVGASPAAGRHPLILLSHGSGARVETMAWLAKPLVEAGFIVAGPNHPGTTSGDSTPADTPKLWERTEDLSRVLTALSADPQWHPFINSDQVGALGFSLGGAAVLDLVGGRVSLEAYARYCEAFPDMADCVWFAGRRGFVSGAQVAVEPLDLRTVDRTRYEQSNRDARVRFAVLVDPSMARAFDPQSLKAIDIPLLFVNQGEAGKVPVSVAADDLARLTPYGSLIHIPQAVHFSFLPECKPDGAKILRSLGDPDALCADGGTRPRSDIHAELADRVTQSFIRQFDGQR